MLEKLKVSIFSVALLLFSWQARQPVFNVISGAEFPKDLVAFWAGAKLFNEGVNPYDTLEVFRLENVYFPLWSKPETFFVNPPWSILPVSPLGHFDFFKLSRFWVFANIFFLAFAFIFHALLLGVKRREQLFLGAAIATLTAHSFVLFYFGQIVGVVAIALFGAAFFLQRGKTLPAAFLFVLATIKPHLVAGACLVVFFRYLYLRRWSFIASALLIFSFFAIYPLWFQPTIYNQWLAAVKQTLAMDHLVLATVVKIFTNIGVDEVGYFRVAFSCLGMFLCFLLPWRSSTDEQFWQLVWPLAICISLASSGYAWHSDFVLMNILAVGQLQKRIAAGEQIPYVPLLIILVPWLSLGLGKFRLGFFDIEPFFAATIVLPYLLIWQIYRYSCRESLNLSTELLKKSEPEDRKGYTKRKNNIE